MDAYHLGLLFFSCSALHFNFPPISQRKTHVCVGLSFSFFLFPFLVTVCSNPGTPSNGQQVGRSSYTYESDVRFDCQKGYHLLGSAVRTCLGDGTWSGQQPTCEGMT